MAKNGINKFDAARQVHILEEDERPDILWCNCLYELFRDYESHCQYAYFPWFS